MVLLIQKIGVLLHAFIVGRKSGVMTIETRKQRSENGLH